MPAFKVIGSVPRLRHLKMQCPSFPSISTGEFLTEPYFLNECLLWPLLLCPVPRLSICQKGLFNWSKDGSGKAYFLTISNEKHPQARQQTRSSLEAQRRGSSLESLVLQLFCGRLLKGLAQASQSNSGQKDFSVAESGYSTMA
ncbi:UDP-glucoronosyl/UDP-glucosyl transferase family protein [Corchorus olitorius]|uniref:UDP-glucoronosyl/UDP-glucosyl transferase family protein n=1 Tax=Corchorus olitorius TaxID=93759 RepID=A0A1R3L1F9_9ROSI|nr:UDP-glucoronosyl/UDP-glucosyl transferase family protein [Corchorus olitorius]